MAIRERIFSGVFPCGIVYADRSVEVNGDYKRLAFLAFSDLELTVEKDCPKDLELSIREDAAKLQARRGKSYQVSTSGQTVLLGEKLKDVQQITRAYELGRTAWHNGMRRTPGHDVRMMKILTGRKIGETPEGEASSTEIMNAWLKAWDELNLAWPRKE